MTFLSCIVGEIDGGTTLGIALRDQRNSHCLVCLVFGWVWLFGTELRECAQSLDNTRD